MGGSVPGSRVEVLVVRSDSRLTNLSSGTVSFTQMLMKETGKAQHLHLLYKATPHIQLTDEEAPV